MSNSNHNKFPKGSEWRKWDLHVHTPASSLSHSFGENWDQYVERLIDAIHNHSISAIVTADYFTVSGYRKLLKYYDFSRRVLSVGDKTANILLVPGVELRLNTFNSEDESINLHVMFDPTNCSPDFIDQHFLEELKVSYRGGEFGLKPQAIVAIGKSIETGERLNQGEDFSGLSSDRRQLYIKRALGAISLAEKDINEALKDIDEVFESQQLPSKVYMIAIVGKGHGSIKSLKWFEDTKGDAVFSRAGLIREDLTHTADLIFSNDPNDRDFYLGRQPDTPRNEVIDRFKSLKPCVWGSDSHDYDNLLHPSNGNSRDYTWIKSDITFEGLRQIVFEPSLRVRIQEDDPADAETYTKIDGCIVNFPEGLMIRDVESGDEIPFCLRGKYEIAFSNNLTCIVGGRGSGKSTFVHLLYNAWNGRDLGKLHEVSSPLTSLQLVGKDALSDLRQMIEVSVPHNAEFFLQNEIEKFARDIQQMSQLVRHRLERLSALGEDSQSLGSLESIWRDGMTAYSELIDAFGNITAAELEISQLGNQIKTLKKQTEVIKSGEYKGLQKDIEALAALISDFESYSKEYQSVTNSIAALRKSLSKLDWNKFEGQNILTSLDEELEKSISELQKAYNKAKIEYEESEYSSKLTAKKEQLKVYLNKRGMAQENIGELADATQKITELEGRIRDLKSSVSPYQEIYSQREDILREYKISYEQYHKRFFEVSGQLQESLSGLKFAEQQSEITFHARINVDRLRTIAIDFIKQSNESKTILSSDNLCTVLFDGSKNISELVEDKENIRNAVEKSSRASIHTQVLQELIADDAFLEKLYLRMYREYYHIGNIQVQTKLGDKLLQSTSFGERCGIVVAIVLVAGTNPIVIDQPEDNLDGKFISNVLVPLIRKQKQNRQIILVTRDANMVITGDSELIMILEVNENGKTDVLPASIEHREYRPKFIWVLDGGEQAFQLREKKYGIFG